MKMSSRDYNLSHKDRHRELSRLYYLENKEKIKNRSRKYRIENKDKIQEHRKKNENSIRVRQRYYNRKYYVKNIDKIRRHNEENKERRRAIWKNYYSNNREDILLKHSWYCSRNREIINQYVRDRRRNDIEFRVTSVLRKRLGRALKSQGAKKADHTKSMIGCSVPDLIRHIESLFLPGMSWGNYGKNGWHIDHIVPCAKFDLTDPNEQRICFNYANLQPLWGPDNLRKNSFYNGKLIRKGE